MCWSLLGSTKSSLGNTWGLDPPQTKEITISGAGLAPGFWFWLCLPHVEVLEPGIQPAPQRWQCRILHPLCYKRTPSLVFFQSYPEDTNHLRPPVPSPGLLKGNLHQNKSFGDLRAHWRWTRLSSCLPTNRTHIFPPQEGWIFWLSFPSSHHKKLTLFPGLFLYTLGHWKPSEEGQGEAHLSVPKSFINVGSMVYTALTQSNAPEKL